MTNLTIATKPPTYQLKFARAQREYTKTFIRQDAAKVEKLKQTIRTFRPDSKTDLLRSDLADALADLAGHRYQLGIQTAAIKWLEGLS